MSILETLLAAVATKTGAAAVGLTVAAGSAGAAGATGSLPDDVQSAFDRAFGQDKVAEQVDEGDDLTTTTVSTDDEHVGDVQDADDQGVAHEVHDVLNGDQDVWPGDEGFGQAVSENARAGGRDFGQSVAEAASGGRSSDGAENADNSNATSDGEEADQTGQSAADAGADNAEVADEHRPQDPPEDAAPEDLPEQAGQGQDTAADARGR